MENKKIKVGELFYHENWPPNTRPAKVGQIIGEHIQWAEGHWGGSKILGVLARFLTKKYGWHKR